LAALDHPFNQPFRRWRLHHRLLTGPAGIFGAVCHDHPILRRDHVEPLRGLLADHMHGRLAAGALGVVGLDRHMDARQMSGKRPAVDSAPLSVSASPSRVSLVVVSLAGGNRLPDILKRQMQLVRIELLRAAAKLRALQLAQQQLLRRQPVPPCNC